MAVLAVFASLVLIGALSGLVVVAVRFQAERREGARVRAIFSRYVAPPIVDELLRRKDPRLYTGRCMHATIVVCRIWNFAGFAESLSAEETLRYLNEFFALAGTSIQKHSGMIDKFLADGIIGVFGVPLEDDTAEEHALRAALDIVRLVDAMDQRWRAQGRRSFQVGIGINSGDVIAGDAGFNERREFTVVGPETLFAARLQEATAELKASVVAAASTCNAVGDRFLLVPLNAYPLHGIKRLVDVAIVLGIAVETETLNMPAAGAFKETRLQPDPPPAFRPAATPQRVARLTPEPPEIEPLPRVELPDPLAPLHPRRRLAENAADSAFAFPEGSIPGDRDFDDDLMLPQRAHGAPHERDDGDRPPIPLPP